MSFNHVKVVSLNVNGLNDVIKRKKVLSKLENKRSYIVFTGYKQEHEKFKQLGYKKTFYSFNKPNITGG